MGMAEELASRIAGDNRLELLARPDTGVVVWRAIGADAERLHALLRPGSSSLTTVAGSRWLRNVAANPNLDVEALIATIDDAVGRL